MKNPINEFLRLNIYQIKNDIVSNLKPYFTSHDFMKEFANTFNTEYVDFLNNYIGNQPMKVHSIIARFLSKNEITLKISKTKKITSVNVYGRKNKIQEWKKD